MSCSPTGTGSLSPYRRQGRFLPTMRTPCVVSRSAALTRGEPWVRDAGSAAAPRPGPRVLSSVAEVRGEWPARCLSCRLACRRLPRYAAPPAQWHGARLLVQEDLVTGLTAS